MSYLGRTKAATKFPRRSKKPGLRSRSSSPTKAHRTAGLRRKRNAKNNTLSEEERRIRDFTLCHDNIGFPAMYRVYQTATPRIYDTRGCRQNNKGSDRLVRVGRVWEVGV